MKQKGKRASLRRSAACAAAAAAMMGMLLVSCGSEEESAAAAVASKNISASVSSSASSDEASSSEAASSEESASSASSEVLTEAQKATRLETYREEILTWVNQERTKKKLASVKMDNESLNAAAQALAEEFAASDAEDPKTRPNGNKWETVLSEYNISASESASALNFAKGSYKNPDEVMAYWMEYKSGGTLVENYTKLGVGFVEKENDDGTATYYWIEIFIEE